MAKNWTAEEDEKIKKWRVDEWSCEKIAAALGNGRSRNAVIGRFRRLGIAFDPLAKRRHYKRVLAPQNKRALLPSKASTETPLKPPVFEDVGVSRDIIVRPHAAPRITVKNLEPHHCRMIHGDLIADRDTWTFCGMERAGGGLFQYCEAHCSIAYQNIKPGRLSLINQHSRTKTPETVD